MCGMHDKSWRLAIGALVAGDRTVLSTHVNYIARGELLTSMGFGHSLDRGQWM